jgi:hypothetical protein
VKLPDLKLGGDLTLEREARLKEIELGSKRKAKAKAKEQHSLRKSSTRKSQTVEELKSDDENAPTRNRGR